MTIKTTAKSVLIGDLVGVCRHNGNPYLPKGTEQPSEFAPIARIERTRRSDVRFTFADDTFVNLSANTRFHVQERP